MFLGAGVVDLDGHRGVGRQAAFGLEAFDGGLEQVFDLRFQLLSFAFCRAGKRPYSSDGHFDREA